MARMSLQTLRGVCGSIYYCRALHMLHTHAVRHASFRVLKYSRQGRSAQLSAQPGPHVRCISGHRSWSFTGSCEHAAAAVHQNDTCSAMCNGAGASATSPDHGSAAIIDRCERGRGVSGQTWEHLSIQPITCRVSTEETSTCAGMWLTVEWDAQSDVGVQTVILVRYSAHQEHIELSSFSWNGRRGRSNTPQLDLKAIHAGPRIAFRVRRRHGFHRFQLQLATPAEAAALVDTIKVRHC